MKKLYKIWFVLLLVILGGEAIGQVKYQAPRALVTPTIDGFGNDAAWATAPWYDINYLWLGTQPSTADFSGRFKISWDANKLYVYAEIVDDVLNDNYTNPLTSYWEDDTWEIFLDENNSGGAHEFTYNAMAYHISRFFDNVDVDVDGSPKLYNQVAQIARTNSGTLYRWEAAFDVYTDAYVYANGTSNPKANLIAGKIMGFAMAYCDNDGGTARQSFIGSEDIPGTNKNVAYQNASVFGKVQLVETVTPQFNQVLVSNGFTNPTVMAMAPDGRIFVAQQQGALRVVKNGALLPTPAVTLTVEASGSYTERGLIGITLDPNFTVNNYIYLYYTTTQSGTHNRVSRFTLNGDVVVPGSEVIIAELDPLNSAVNHNGGALHFGKDGKLYIATGDNFVPAYAQSLTNTHGKILRLNPDGTIPSDNPYASAVSNSQKMIWCYGLRNPFTFDIQTVTGRIFVNDVGQDAWEEINDVTTGAGRNYGWPNVEGRGTNPAYVNPLYAYGHTASTTIDSTGCAITGGCFFDPLAGTNYPSRFLGKYFYMDYCNNWINVLDPATGKRQELFARNVSGGAPIAIDVHIDGNLYFLSRSGGLYRITYSGNVIPDILAQPQSQVVPASQPVTFTVQASGANPMFYSWRKNGAPIANATSSSFTIASVSGIDAGNYTVVVFNAAGSVTSNIATLSVTAFNSRPVATITSPVFGTRYNGGQTFTFTGTAFDVQDGTLPASAFTWEVDLHHASHVHDGVPLSSVTSFQYTIPVAGHADTNTYYRIRLYVRDSGGLTDTAIVNIYPNMVVTPLITQPAGLRVTIDGQPFTTPVFLPSVVGTERTIGVVTPQSSAGKAYAFSYWSQGGPATQTFPMPTTTTTYTAFFNEIPITRDSIAPLRDAFVQFTSYAAADANTNYGTSTQLVVKNFVNTPNRETYITFNLNRLAGSRANISNAVLRLYGSMLNENGLTNLILPVFESVTTNWAENTITFNNRPGNLNTTLATVTVSSTVAGFYTWDLTNFIKSKTAPADSIVSIVIRSNSDHMNRVIFNSRESGTNIPQLVVDFTTPCTVTSTITSSGATSLCQGSTVTLRSATGTGWGYTWFRNGNVITTGTSFITTSTAGVYAVQTSNGPGCTALSSTLTVTSTPLVTPSIVIQAPNTSVCTGNSLTVSASGTNIGTLPTYTWFRNGLFLGTGQTRSLVPSHNDQIRVIATVGGVLPACLATTTVGSISYSATVLGISTASLAISVSANGVCSGTGVVFSSTGMNLGSSPTIAWFRNNTFVANGVSVTRTPSHSDTWFAVATLGGTLPVCPSTVTVSSSTIIMSVTGLATPSVSVLSSPLTLCSGLAASATLNGTNLGSAPVIRWIRNGNTLANTNTISFTPNNSDFVQALVTVGGVLPNCLSINTLTSSGLTYSVTPTNTPSVQLLASSSTVCGGGNLTISASGTALGNNPTFAWRRNAISIGSGTSLVVSPSPGDVFSVIASVGGILPSCLSSTAATSTGFSPTVLANQTAVLVVSVPSTSVCSGSSVTATVSAINAGTSPSIRWRLNGIAQAAFGTSFTWTPAQNDVISAMATVGGGTLCWVSNTTTSSGIQLSVSGTVTATSAISVSTTNVCAGTMVTLSSTHNGTGSVPNYQWLVNGQPQTQTGTTFNFIPQNNDNVVVRMTPGGSGISCIVGGPTTSNGLSFTVRSASAAPVASNVNVCPGQSVSGSNVSGTNLRWFVQGQGGNRQPFPISIPATTSGTLNYQVTQNTNGCESPAAGFTVTVNSIATPQVTIVSSQSVVCSGTGVSFTASGTNVGTQPSYVWYKNGQIVGSGNTVSQTPSLGDGYVVTVTVGGSLPACLSATTAGSPTFSITVNAPGSSSCPLPTASSISGPAFVLVGSTNVVYSISSTAGQGYQWSVPAGSSIVSGQGSAAIVVNFPSNTLSGFVSVAVSNANGAVNSSVQVTTGSLPVVSTIAGATTLPTDGSPVTYSIASLPGVSYVWTVPTGVTIISGQGTPNLTVSATGTVNGIVQVAVTNVFGTSTTQIQVVSAAVTGIAEDVLVQVEVVPNPFESGFVINTAGNAKYTVYDLAGHVIELGEYSNSKQLGSQWNPGAYILKIDIGSKTKLQKVVKY